MLTPTKTELTSSSKWGTEVIFIIIYMILNQILPSLLTTDLWKSSSSNGRLLTIFSNRKLRSPEIVFSLAPYNLLELNVAPGHQGRIQGWWTGARSRRLGVGFGELCPLPRKFLNFYPEITRNGAFLCILQSAAVILVVTATSSVSVRLHLLLQRGWAKVRVTERWG